jgi:hypothetical protein
VLSEKESKIETLELKLRGRIAKKKEQLEQVETQYRLNQEIFQEYHKTLTEKDTELKKRDQLLRQKEEECAKRAIDLELQQSQLDSKVKAIHERLKSEKDTLLAHSRTAGRAGTDWLPRAAVFTGAPVRRRCPPGRQLGANHIAAAPPTTTSLSRAAPVRARGPATSAPCVCIAARRPPRAARRWAGRASQGRAGIVALRKYVHFSIVPLRMSVGSASHSLKPFSSDMQHSDGRNSGRRTAAPPDI